MSYDSTSRDRGDREDTSGSIPVIVTAVYLDGEPRVKVRPQAIVPFDTFDGAVVSETPLEIDQVPYVYPSSNDFALFIPPAVGMQGFLSVTQIEVGEVAAGTVKTSRRRDQRSGYFVPGGNVTGQAFKGNAAWTELRSAESRVALSKDTVHLQAGAGSIVITENAFDIVVGGVSLIAALKEMSAHIAKLEALVHQNGAVHGPVNSRIIDNITAASVPQRAESGVR